MEALWFYNFRMSYFYLRTLQVSPYIEFTMLFLQQPQTEKLGFVNTLSLSKDKFHTLEATFQLKFYIFYKLIWIIS